MSPQPRVGWTRKSDPATSAPPKSVMPSPPQNRRGRRSPKKAIPARATHSGAVLANSVALAALVMLTPVLHNAMSMANEIPPRIAKRTPRRGHGRPPPLRSASGKRATLAMPMR